MSSTIADLINPNIDQKPTLNIYSQSLNSIDLNVSQNTVLNNLTVTGNSNIGVTGATGPAGSTGATGATGATGQGISSISGVFKPGLLFGGASVDMILDIKLGQYTKIGNVVNFVLVL